MKTRFKCAFLIMTAVASFQPGDALALGPAAPDKVKWESDYDKAVERALSDGKGIMVWVRESPCRICASLKELRMRKYLATKGNAFRPVVPMKIEQEELSLPLSDRKILALRPLVYANSQDYHRVIYLDNHSRRRMSGPLVTFVGSLIVHPDHASRFCATWLEQVDRAKQRGFVAVDGQAWGRSTAIKARNGVLDDLVKQPAALVGEIAVDEDPAVLLHLLQKIKTASEPGAEVVWRRILLDGNSFVQRAGLASLLRIRKGGGGARL
ncbi:MAG: hypothetical protein CMJ84_11770 [Planctomycetes bacterium]|nr:hypothetical protein [Planctomycetota bacterium]